MEKYDIDDEFDPSYMRRAIELARRGTGAVNPNPLVGADRKSTRLNSSNPSSSRMPSSA